MNTPVVLIIFKRPTLTRRVFAEIARARPKRLLVVADGPRTPAEADLCEEARAIVNDVDWECEVFKNFSEVNMGCGHRPASGISWAFEHCDEAIILEDDCVPHPSFFPYCEALLEKYRDDERVMIISGFNHQPSKRWTHQSYYFSRLPVTWGWATWRRAWKHFDFDIKLWKELRNTSFLDQLFGSPCYSDYYHKIFDTMPDQTWDYQWYFAIWSQSGLVIRPCVNLVSNIGYGPDATHTFYQASQFGFTRAEEITFPLSHPVGMVCHREADLSDLYQVAFEFHPSLLRMILRKCKRGLAAFFPWVRRKGKSS